jgi:hypothetical protein
VVATQARYLTTARRFTWRIDMPMVISLSYGEIVLPTKDAVTLMEILQKAERYRKKYNDSNISHHIYPNEDNHNAQLITDDLYRMAKLAGKPED